MIKYCYQVLRYVHDYVTEEFVNVGLVLFSQESSYLKFQFANQYSRISKFFNQETQSIYITKQLREIQREFDSISSRIQHGPELFEKFESLQQITSKVLPVDDSALVFSELRVGIDLVMDAAFDDLFQRLVAHYIDKPEEQASRDDQEVWRKVYKTYLDQYGVTPRLTAHNVTTPFEQIEFPQAWKNGAWNCYKPLSFDLKEEAATKNKVYKWSGLLSELSKVNEELHLFLLVAEPKERSDINDMITEYFNDKKIGSLHVTLVREGDAENFARQQKHALDESQEHKQIGGE